jgi:hypothetical protein
MCEIDWKVIMDLVLAVATVTLAWKTWNLATATKKMVDESKEGSLRQIGVQTWLALEARFDSKEMKLHRQRLSQDLPLLNIMKRHDDINDTVFELFESIGSLYNRGLIDTGLAESSFSFHVAGWWQIAQQYIEAERRRHKDNEIYCEFQEFAESMIKLCPNIDLDKFVKDERMLVKE